MQLASSFRYPNQELQRLSIEFADRVGLDSVNALLAARFPPGRCSPPQPHRRETDLGWWDCGDATLSVINLQTLRSLAAKAGQPIDPLRYRSNLHWRCIKGREHAADRGGRG